MVAKFKQLFYFPVASYFRFFASIRLKRWNPKIVVITGSNGKTTLLYMLESQIGGKAKYSHHANSSFGIPFDILDLHRKSLLKSEWISLILKTPLNAFKKPPKERLYIVEADCDRPGEGKFLASFLRPSVVLWVSTGRTHSMNFDHLVSRHPERSEGSLLTAEIDSSVSPQNDRFSTVEDAIAYEFGYFLEYCKDLAVINGDSQLMQNQIKRTKAKVIDVKKSRILKSHEVGVEGTKFEIEDAAYKLKDLLPEEVFYSVVMCRKTVEYLDFPFDSSFSEFFLPPGRGSVFKGIKNTTLIDSSYNANLLSMKVMINMFSLFPGKKKWVVLGDMLELGKEEQSEHENLAEVLNAIDLDRIILIGKLCEKYTLSKLKDSVSAKSFKHTDKALPYIMDNLSGGEKILFKGSQSLFLEGVIEPLLRDRKDVARLPRQEQYWKDRRRQIGLGKID